MKVAELQVEMLEECVRVNVRAKVNAAVVAEYAEAYEAGAVLPPVVVFREKGCERYIVADGRHRLAAAKKAGRKHVEADLHDGDETDALKFALQCNSEHGLRRTKADLLHAVSQLMTNKRLSDEYRTHRDRSELLRISARSFQSLLADWRGSNGGSKAEQKAKAEAQESAVKHTPVPKAPAPKKEAPPVPPPKKGPPKPETTREQKKVAQQVREAHKVNGSAKPVSAAQKMNFTRMLACSKDLPPAGDLIASGANISWDDIESLHDWTTELLENR